MADGDGPIASAVIIPDPLPESAPSKRRQSDLGHDSTSKRPRLSLSEASPPNSPQNAAVPDPSLALASKPANVRSRESIIADKKEERKRGQRLFGGLISTLSQSTSNGQQKRRLEIEKRQQERAKQQKAEDEVRKAKKREELKAVRQEEQVKYNEQSMRTRHSNLLAMAHFLSTKANPKLYYKPWKMLPEEEERIKIQIIEAESLIEREIAEFEDRHPKEKQEKQVAKTEAVDDTSTETVGEPVAKSPSVPTLEAIDTTNSPAQATQSEIAAVEEKRAVEEHNGEVVVENEEDTVIY